MAEEQDALQLRCPITTDLALLRRQVRDYATIAGMSGQRLDDLILAVNEATGNVLEHGGAGTLTARADIRGVRVDIVDDAGTLTAGHLNHSPSLPTRRGFGLLIIRALCDEVLLDHPGGHSRLRLFMRYPAVSGAPEEPEQAGTVDD